MPSSAARPVPTMTAVGVARPRAQGQAMIRTAMVVVIAIVRFSVAGPKTAQSSERGERAEDDRGHEDRGDLVGQPLHGDLGALRVLDEADDLGQRGVVADGGGPDLDGAGGVEGGADDGVAGGLVDREALAGEHALVDRGGAADDDAVDGDLLAGTDADDVADDDLLDRDVDLGRRRGRTRAVLGASPTSAVTAAAVRFLALASIHFPASTSATMISDGLVVDVQRQAPASRRGRATG